MDHCTSKEITGTVQWLTESSTKNTVLRRRELERRSPCDCLSTVRMTYSFLKF